MLTPQYILPMHPELVVDLFAGGGGASTGIEQAVCPPLARALVAANYAEAQQQERRAA